MSYTSEPTSNLNTLRMLGDQRKGIVDEAELWVQKTSDTQERVSKVSIFLYNLYRNMSVIKPCWSSRSISC